MGKGVCASSQRAACEVRAPSQRATYGSTCLHGFVSGPSLSSLLPEEQHFLLVRDCGQGLLTKALPPLPPLPHGASGRGSRSSAWLVREGIGLAFGSTGGESP